MKEPTLRTDITLGEILEGFLYNQHEEKAVAGWNGKLIIQPEYQRNYIYGNGIKDVAVVNSVLNSFPIGLLYFNRTGPDKYEVLDGQQRITSLGRFYTGLFAIKDEKGMEQYFFGLDKEKQDTFLNTHLTIYVCEDLTEEDIKSWFETINIGGVPLNDQELLNAVYSGPFVSAAKAIYSNGNLPLMQKWQCYIKGSVNRQDILEAALKWRAGGKEKISGYMSQHRMDADITDLNLYFNSVIDWAKMLFGQPKKEMRGLDWGILYERFHNNVYDPVKIRARVEELYIDECVSNNAGIFEYVLGGEEDPSLLQVRVFDPITKSRVYARQTKEAKSKGVSNCPLCAISNTSLRTRIYALKEMDADHVTAWSKGGATDESNCQMLCKMHNQSKGNK